MSNIDEKAKNNFTIEMRIFENYEKEKIVKRESSEHLKVRVFGIRFGLIREI